ncbi:hypothetical protein [Streptomyces sp. NPDC015130]|uniref:hypothetical protein n=1 Tax=Streptomyces sp. NPDC015130 TaxID=3364940 RepID=UPI0036F85D60
MNTRRALVALLAALLTGGCVAVPEAPAPNVPPRPGGLAPAAERPPSALPAWPEPTEARPRENLAATEPRPGRPPAKPDSEKPAPPKAAPAQHRRTPGQTAGEAPGRPAAPRKNPGTTTERRKPERAGKTTRRTAPATAPKTRSPRPAPAPRPTRPVTGQAPEMRRLCRQAQEIDAPMGAADLCRGMYGR